MRRSVVEIMESDQHQFGVIGAGAWGTAIARHLSIKGFPVRIWCKETETADSIIKDHVNSVFLPDILLPESLDATTDLLDITRNANILLATTPSHLHVKLPELSILKSQLSISWLFSQKELNRTHWH